MFSRTISLIGENSFKNLQNKTVAILGVGGVGSYAVEALARSGILHLIIIDADKIDISNLNRQLMTNINNVGKYKVDVLEERIKTINPSCKIDKIKEFITPDNLDLIFNFKPDYIIDAIDTLETKKALIKECLIRKVKFISSTGMGNKLDATKVVITDLSKTSYDKIAKELRIFVKKEKIKGKIPVVFSDEKPKENNGVIASIVFVPAVAGLLCASYVVKEILKDDTNEE